MKQVVIIGATSGIGRGLAERLAAAGWRVGAVGRRGALLRELAESAPANILYAERLFWVMPVNRVVDQMLRALFRGRRVAVVTRRWRLVAWLLRWLPESLYLKL